MTAFSKLKPAEKFAEKWRTHGLVGGDPETEHRFDSDGGRRWRFDFAWPDQRLAVEVDGLGYGHQAVVGMAADNEKQNAAVQQGWSVLRFNSKQLGSHASVEAAVQQVCEVLCSAIELRD